MGKTLIATGSVAMTALATLALMPQPQYGYTPWYHIALTVIFALATFICLIIGFIYFWKFIVYQRRKYQKPPSKASKTIGGRAIPPAIRTGTKILFGTGNSKDWTFEYEGPIQGVRFIRPIEKYIWPDDHHPFVHCEHRVLWRLLNKMTCVPTPRIVVKFTETGNGIILNEENTYGVQVELELLPTPPQVKRPTPGNGDSQI